MILYVPIAWCSGTNNPSAAKVMRELYRLYLLETPIVQTTLETSELTKYAANAFLATKITFINEIADLCEKVGANVGMWRLVSGWITVLGRNFFTRGRAMAVRVSRKTRWRWLKQQQNVGAPVRIVETVIDINDKRKKSMARRVIDAAGGSVEGKTVAVLGVAFKPNTDDMRDSVALDVIPALQQAGAKVRPLILSRWMRRKILADVDWRQDVYDALSGADVAVILTEWNEFRALDFERMKKLMKTPSLVDLRNIYRSDMAVNAGFTYSSIGRGV